MIGFEPDPSYTRNDLKTETKPLLMETVIIFKQALKNWNKLRFFWFSVTFLTIYV